MTTTKKPGVMNDSNTPVEQMSAWERWHLPNMEVEGDEKTSAYNRTARKPVSEKPQEEALDEEIIRPPTAEEIEQIRQAAYEDGLEQGREAGHREGYDAGYAGGESEAKAALTRLSQICRALLEPIPAQDDELEQVLLHLVEQICKRVVHRELTIDSSAMLSIVRSALDTLNPGEQRLKIHLNGQDAQWIEQRLKADGEWHEHWRIQPHPSITPGGCIIETESSMVDARAEKRLASVIRQVYEQQQQALEEHGQQHGHVDQLLDEIERFVDDDVPEIANPDSANPMSGNENHFPQDDVLPEHPGQRSQDGSQSTN